MKTLVLFATLLLTVAQAQTTVTFWHSFGDNEAMTTLLQRFNDSHSDVQVAGVDVGGYDDMVTRLQAAVVSGRLPDVVQLEITRYGIFADRGVLEPLDELVADTPDFNVGDLIPSIWAAAQYKGTPFVIPFNNSVPLMYYNRDAFTAAGLDPNKPPKTWDELLTDAEALTVRQGDTTTQWGLSAPPQWVRNAFVKQNGGRWMNPELTSLTLTSPEAEEAYSFMHDFIYQAKVAYAEAGIDANGDLSQQDFVSGRTAIIFTSTGDLGGLEEDTDFDLGVAALPCHKSCAAPIGGATLGIIANRPAEQRDAAWTFLTWMTNTANNAYWHTETGYMPIRQSTLKTQVAENFYQQNPSYRVAIDELQSAGFARPRPPAMPAIRELELTAWEEIATNTKTVEQALQDLKREADALLAGN